MVSIFLGEGMKRIVLLLLACLVFGQYAVAGTVKIGLMCPLTGSWASEGQDMRNIVTLLNDQVNAAGGIHGQQVEVIVEDDGGNPRSASLAAQKLSSSNVLAVIGTYGSAVTEAAQHIYNESGIVQVATGSTSNRLTEKDYPGFFRVCPRNDQQGDVAARVLLQMGYRDIGILHDNSSYAKGMADETRKRLEQFRANIVFFDALTPGEQDYTATLVKLKSCKPEVIFFSGYYPEAGMLLRQKHGMGWEVPLIGGDATNNLDLVKIAGQEAASGFYFISPPLAKDLMDGGQARKILADYEKKYNSLPGSVWAVLAGDAYSVIVKALRASKDCNSTCIANYLRDELKDFSGLTGQISFDRKGDRVGDVYRLYKVDRDGRFVLQPVTY